MVEPMTPLRFLGVTGAAVLTAVALCAPASAHTPRTPRSTQRPRSAQTPPATAGRPILSATEAAPFTVSNYSDRSGPYAAPVRDPWHPRDIAPPHRRPDYVVGPTAGAHGVTHTT